MTGSSERARVAALRQGADADALADALVAMAGALVNEGEIADARAALDEAAATHAHAGRKDDERHCRQFSATLSRLIGDLDGAEIRAQRAAALSPDGTPGAVSAAAELGEIALARGNATAGAVAFGDALRQAGLASQRGSPLLLHPAEESGLLRKQAVALAASARPDSATAALDKAQVLLGAAGDAEGARRADIEAITVLQNAGRHDDAARRRDAAFAAARRDDDQFALADLELLESAAAVSRRDVGAALAAATRARTHALEARAPISYLAAAVAMAELFEKDGDRQQAYATLATGYATLADLLGRDVANETFGLKLRDCRDRWGIDVFRRVKGAYERERAASRLIESPSTESNARHDGKVI